MKHSPLSCEHITHTEGGKVYNKKVSDCGIPSCPWSTVGK